MPKLDLYNMKGEVVGDVDLSEGIFGIEVKPNAMHTVVINQLANRRQGTQSTKTKSEVRGGGKKPWRQKGTGRARQGSTRSAQWIKGGIVLGPKPRSYSYTLPKKLKRLALKSALTSKVNDSDVLVLDKLGFEAIKTKEMAGVLKNLKLDDSVLIVTSEKSDIIQKSARNIPGVKTALVNTINVFDILKYEKLVVTKDAVAKIEEVYA
ncbi:LSU ribosomal protein L4P [Anaerobacterium chartisolvens]|uniref:Large ribosomal subunit protein uL4 n=1 Tax=Anaerobacterium chartisolvens TaxID=1297424 RepID=A0A369ATU6_9FIRM|nr:50S ribosomal protein L4 [Anaerobacterium chartisolvens]RCX12792.1 LSU ribosomal protein L4P [Anaerobacterium chartisolvens]